MFCSKCGTQISISMRNCPNCGAINENYDSKSADDTESKSDGKKLSMPVKIIGAVAGVAVLSVIGIWAMQNRPEKKESRLSDKIEYTSRGFSCYTSDDTNTAYFFEGGPAYCIEGAVDYADGTPDHTKIVVLGKDKKLVYLDEEKKSTDIAEKADSISRLANDFCYYTVGSKKHLYCYSFTTGETADIGFEDMDLTFSSGKNTVIAVNNKGEMYKYSVGDKEPTDLCNIGTDDDTDICCVADDGSNVFWCTKEGSTFSVYMMKNGAPERIGKVKNANTYSSVYGYFYNNDNGCLLYSSGSSQMLMYKEGEIIEIALPGVKSYDTMVNYEGMAVDSDDDLVGDLFLSVSKNKSSSKVDVYKLSPDGNMQFVVGDVVSDSWNSSYFLKNGYVFYIDPNSDFIMKEIDSEEEGQVVTTDVNAINISPSGKYAYIIKSGGLYYCDLSEKDLKINLISGDYHSDDDSFYLTDKDEVVFYITDTKDIKDSYSDKGVLYQYTVGGEVVKISEDIMYVKTNDSKYVLAEYPIIQKYISNKESDFIVNYGTVVGDKYVDLAEGLTY